MFVVTINNNDSSKHTLEVDAQRQKTIFENAGFSNVEVIEKETFNPPQE